jgi:hypothetical protein
MNGSSERSLMFRANGELLFSVLCLVVPAISGLMLFFLAFARREIFSAIDPSLFVAPFLSYTLAMPCGVISVIFSALYTKARFRLWLYPAVAFGALAVILFIAGTLAVTYLIIL